MDEIDRLIKWLTSEPLTWEETFEPFNPDPSGFPKPVTVEVAAPIDESNGDLSYSIEVHMPRFKFNAFELLRSKSAEWSEYVARKQKEWFRQHDKPMPQRYVNYLVDDFLGEHAYWSADAWEATVEDASLDGHPLPDELINWALLLAKENQ